MNITQFTMEEVRCFSERQTLEIRPLTFLVGENSTGKTTALACFHILADYLQGRGVDFNSHPYSMGTFKDIVRNSRKKEKVFRIGFVSKYADEDVEWTVEFMGKKEGIEPVVSSVTVKFSDGEIVFETRDSSKGVIRLAAFVESRNEYQIACDVDVFAKFSLRMLLDLLDDPLGRFLEGGSAGQIALARYLSMRANSAKIRYEPWDIWDIMSVSSLAPTRAFPKRTYDPTREFNDPEGSDVPMYLMRIEATQKENWEALRQQLVEFGRSSGLFQDIEIKNLGRALGAPFQLRVKVRGPKVSIIGVGYGVSQILPILVHILNPDISKNPRRDPKQPTFSLLQQPEIHLHPRAQAEFSSLLVKLADRGDQSFIVETHGDYMIDRARIEIRRGNIRPEDVSLIYFEPKGNIVTVHNIGFDKMGNMEGVPPHYREFFLKESDRLMGFED